MTLLYFLYRNGWWIDVDNDVLYKFANQVAKSAAMDSRKEIVKIRSFLRKHVTRG